MDEWVQADRVSDRIVDILNDELEKVDSKPLQVLAGQMLAFCAIASTMPKSIVPQPFIDVMDTIQRCLDSMREELDGK